VVEVPVFVSCWSVKGGAGTTVVATTLARILASRSTTGSLLVDLAGDVPALLGLEDGDGPGVSDWLAAGDTVPADGWARLEVATPIGVAVVPRGRGTLSAVDRAEVLVGILAAERRPVVVDCGLLPTVGPRDESAATVLASLATRSVLVTRACRLSLRRAQASPFRPSDVVLVRELGRHLVADDVAELLGVDVWAEVLVDTAVAGAIDAGSLGGRRLPRHLRRAFRHAA
jgi:hypothetical protein